MKLSEIRERDNVLDQGLEDLLYDRRELLQKLDVAMNHMRHDYICGAILVDEEAAAIFGASCTCGLDAALKEIEG